MLELLELRITNQSSVAGILSSCALGVDCTRLQRVPYSRLSRGGFNPENNFKFRSKGQGQLPAAVSFLQKNLAPRRQRGQLEFTGSNAKLSKGSEVA